MSNHHYYASYAYGWSVGATADEAKAGIVEHLRKNLLRPGDENAAFDRALKVRVCRVEAPITASYTIDDYWPVEVELNDKVFYHLLGFVNGEPHWNEG